MGQCLSLSQSGEYAIASLSRLALYFPESVPVEVLARVQGIPRAFLSKILGRCAKVGIVRAKTGPAGGISLSRAPEHTSLLDIIEACEGGLLRSHCIFYSERACDGPACLIYCPLRRKEENIRQELRGTTLADMARSLKDHPLNQGERSWTR